MRARAASASWIVSAGETQSSRAQAEESNGERTESLQRPFALALHLALLFIVAHVLTRYKCEAFDSIRRRPTAWYM
jgi:hypothetical protein